MSDGKRLIGLLVVTATVIFGAGCSPEHESAAVSSAQAAAPAAATPASSTTVTAGAEPDRPPIAQPPVYSGAIVVEHQLDVAALRDGVITTISADVGTAVRRAEVLAILDDRQLRADRAAALARAQGLESDLKNWQAELKVLAADQQRAERMWQANLITQEQLEHARFQTEADRYEVESHKHQLENARASLQSLDLELEKTRITAPFAGVVARRYVRVGQRVAAGDRLFWLTAVSPLLVRFTLPNREAHHIARGGAIKLQAVDDQAVQHRARVLSVSPVVDPASDSVEVIARIVGPPGDLKPGLTVNVSLGEHR